jgi:branched-chain amino acid transport system permease protein
MVSLGIAIIAMEIMSHWINNGLPVSFPVLPGRFTIRLGMVFISMKDLLTLLGCILLMVAFFNLLYRTKQGRALRAVAQDTDKARIIGIPVVRTMYLSFALAGFMAGIIGILLAISLGSASSVLGDHLAIKSMAVLLFAGVGNLKGGLICALILGVAEAMTMGYLPGQWVEAVAFSIIIVMLVFKPDGLFGPQN